jgi:hypothetical protein
MVTGEGISYFRMITLRAGLKMECLGMKRHGESCYKIIKREYNLTGSKQEVLAKFEEFVRAKKETLTVVREEQ